MTLCSTKKRSEQKLDACHLFFGERECRKIKFAKNFETDLDEHQFDLNAITEDYEEKRFVVFCDNTGTAPVEPDFLDEDQELIYVSLAALDDDTAVGVAEKFAEVLGDKGFWKIEAEGSTLHIRNLFLGKITEEEQDAEKFVFTVAQAGFGGSLGASAQGGSTLSTETIVEEIMADHTGDTLLDEIIKGQTLSLETTLVEMTEERWEAIVGNVAGDVVSKNDTKLIGYGTSKLFKSKQEFAGMLVLHPVNRKLSDRSSDYVIHKTSPDMSSINFSGSEVQGAEITFKAYADQTIDEKVNLFVRGDYTKL